MIVTTHTRVLRKALSLLALSIVFLLAGAGTGMAQSKTSDQALVLKQVVNLPELQALYPKTAGGARKPLVIMQHAVSFPTDIAVRFGGQSLRFLSKEQLKSGQTDAYFYFNDFRVEGNSARVEFTYYYDQTAAAPKMQVVALQLQKSEKGWSITQTQNEAR